MRYAVLIAMLAAVALPPLIGYAQQMTTPSTVQAEEQRVLATEDDYAAAEVSRDEAKLRTLIDDRFVLNSSRGTTSGKEALIQQILKMAMVGQTLRERSVLLEGDIALIFGTAELRFASPGKPESVSTLRYTSTYVKRQGEWRLVALQMQQRAPN